MVGVSLHEDDGLYVSVCFIFLSTVSPSFGKPNYTHPSHEGVFRQLDLL